MHPPKLNSDEERSGVFRKEAVDNASTKRYGTVLLLRPVSHSALVLLFVAIAAVIVGFFTSFEFQRKIPVAGVLNPKQGVVRIVAPMPGTVIRHDAAEGQSVKAGDILFVLSTERESRLGGEASKSSTELVSQRRDMLQVDRMQVQRQAEQRQAAAHKKANDLSAEIVKLESQLSLQRQRVEIEESAYAQNVELQSKSFISTAQLRSKKADLLDQRQRLADIERAKSSTQRELSDVLSSAAEIRIQSERDQSAIARSISSTEQELSESQSRRDTVIRSPIDGVVSSISSVQGQSVAANTPLAVVLPAGSALLADLYVPSRAIGFIKPGMTVLIRYQAFPYQKFGSQEGVIEEVTDATVIEVAGMANDSSREPVYKVRTRLPRQVMQAYGVDRPLKQGMQLEASIMTEKRRLYEWVLDPLYAVSGKV